MYRPRRTRGLAGDQPGCTFWEFGVFKPQCWCLDHPSFCSQEQNIAARAWADASVYATLKQPPVAAAPTGAALTTPPASGEQAQALADALAAQQVADWQAQNRASMQQTQVNLDQIAADLEEEKAGPNWMLYGGIALAGVLAVSVMGGGSPRRYGR